MYSSYSPLQRRQLREQTYTDTQSTYLLVYAPGRRNALTLSLAEQLHRKFRLVDRLEGELTPSVNGVLLVSEDVECTSTALTYFAAALQQGADLVVCDAVFGYDGGSALYQTDQHLSGQRCALLSRALLDRCRAAARGKDDVLELLRLANQLAQNCRCVPQALLHFRRELCSKCRRPSCLHPKMCPNLDNDHRPLLDLYAKVRAVKGVKKAFIGSGIRYDLFDGSDYLDTVIRHHTSGRLKVAPEHTEDTVLKLMRKPPFAMFERLNADFNRICRREGLPYQLIPYFISSHPGCTERDMRSLADKVLGKLHFDLEQVQDLTPTPMTFSSVMFYTGENPYTGEKVYVARSQEEKRRQKSYFFRRKR